LDLVNEVPAADVIKRFYGVTGRMALRLEQTVRQLQVHVLSLPETMGVPAMQGGIRPASAYQPVPARAADMLQWRFQEQAAGRAMQIAAFASRIDLRVVELVLLNFHSRVLKGVKPELIQLTRIREVRGATARLLYSGGLSEIKDVAESSVEIIHAALVKGLPPDRRKNCWKRAARIFDSAKRIYIVCSPHPQFRCDALVASMSSIAATAANTVAPVLRIYASEA
jgi:hypothetical protein